MDQIPAYESDKKRDSQHRRGKLTVSERLELLCDAGSFVENAAHSIGRTHAFGLEQRLEEGDGAVTGTALIDGNQVWIAAQDFTVLGGSLGEMHAARVAGAIESAISTGTPFIQINDSGGARIQEGVLALEGYGRIFRANTIASGLVPQISVILGPCAGGAVYSPAITDFVVMVDSVSNMYITGPEVIRQVTGEEITHDALGGAESHARESGVAHARFTSEAACMAWVRKLLTYLPRRAGAAPAFDRVSDPPDRLIPEIDSIIPSEDHAAYDVRDVIRRAVDTESFLEIHAEYAANVVVGFARLAGRCVGIIASQPAVLAGALDIDASDKVARFVRCCDSFGIPIVSLADVPGFLPGVAQEHGGIIRHGAKFLYAIAEATVPKIALVLRKAYGGAYVCTASKQLGFDRVLALPNAQIAVMGPAGASAIIFRKEIASSADPDAERRLRESQFREGVMDPHVAAGLGYVDQIIEPPQIRRELIRAVEAFAHKSEIRPGKKHGSIPL